MKHFGRKLLLFLSATAISVILLPLGWRMGYLWSADRATKLVIREIEAFKSRTGRLPALLSELSPQVGGDKTLKLQGLSDAGLVWSINYQNMSNSSYRVTFNHVHYDVDYQDGRRGSVNFNFFRYLLCRTTPV